MNLQSVSFSERATNYRALWRKMTYQNSAFVRFLRGWETVATSSLTTHTHIHTHTHTHTFFLSLSHFFSHFLANTHTHTGGNWREAVATSSYIRQVKSHTMQYTLQHTLQHALQHTLQHTLQLTLQHTLAIVKRLLPHHLIQDTQTLTNKSSDTAMGWLHVVGSLKL